MFEICYELWCHILFSFTTHHSPNVLLNQTIPVTKTQTIGSKTWKRMRVEVIACGISWSKLESAWEGYQQKRCLV